MYRVTICNGNTATIIHEPTADQTKPHLYTGTMVQGSSGEIDTLSFDILPNNPGYDLLAGRTTMVEAYNTITKEVEFSGRVLTITPQMDSTGLIYKSVVCEDRLGFLCDSIQPYTAETTYYGDDDTSGVEKFLTLLLDNHNSQVEDYKKIYPGDISYTTSSNNCTKGLNYETTWEAIASKLLTDLGGEIRLKEGADGLLYLDYVPELGEDSEVTIELGKNMTSIAQEIDPTDIITRLIPLGAYLEAGEDDATDTTERVTIASVNDGCIWIDDEEAQAVYGIVSGTVEWEDVTEPANLLAKAKAWLEAQIRADKITLTALDLSIIGLEADTIKRYNRHRVVNAAIGLDASIRVLKRTANICDPTDITFEMGERASTLTSTVVSGGQQVKTLYESIINVGAIANGKTTSYYADEAPAGTGYVVNDIWFDTSDGYKMYYWTGEEWTAAPFGTDALGEGIITTELLAAGCVTAGKIAVGSLSAISANLGTITGGSININDVFSISSDGVLTSHNSDNTQYIVMSNGNISALGSSWFSLNDTKYYPFLQIYGGDIDVFANGYDDTTSPIGSIRINPSGIDAFMVDDSAWFGVSNLNKNVYVSGTLCVNNFDVPQILCGRVSVSVTKGENTEFEVTFERVFSGTPTVVITPRHTYADTSELSYKILTASSTGFTGCIYDNATRTFALNWIAMY